MLLGIGLDLESEPKVFNNQYTPTSVQELTDKLLTKEISIAHLLKEIQQTIHLLQHDRMTLIHTVYKNLLVGHNYLVDIVPAGIEPPESDPSARRTAKLLGVKEHGFEVRYLDSSNPDTLAFGSIGRMIPYLVS